MKKSKRIELTDDCIKYWAKKAIDEGSNFKAYVERYLEHEAVRLAKKNKNK